MLEKKKDLKSKRKLSPQETSEKGEIKLISRHRKRFQFYIQSNQRNAIFKYHFSHAELGNLYF